MDLDLLNQISTLTQVVNQMIDEQKEFKKVLSSYNSECTSYQYEDENFDPLDFSNINCAPHGFHLDLWKNLAPNLIKIKTL